MTALLPIRMVEKPWGRDVLPAPFVAPEGQRIGEIWFEPPRGFAQLLVKYIFTSEALSVQVHPSDAQLPGQGKEECWLVVAAEPGARLGLGFREPIGPEAMRAAALDGTIEDLLEWYPVAAGDFFHVPPNTVHAIGAGVSLIEVQQNSAVTYRLYDYGRPRELHLDAGISVAEGVSHPPALGGPIARSGAVSLVDGPQFRLDRLDGAPDAETVRRYGTDMVLVVPIEGVAQIGTETIEPGQCGIAPSLAAARIAGTVLVAQPCTP